MPEQATIKRAERDKREGKSPTTQAGEFVREEMHHIREGKHGARSAKQAIAIGLSKARCAGVDLPPPEKGQTSERTRKSAETAFRRGHGEPSKRKPSAKRSRAIHKVLEREGKSAASHKSLSKQAHAAARRKTAGERGGRPKGSSNQRTGQAACGGDEGRSHERTCETRPSGSQSGQNQGGSLVVSTGLRD